MTVILLLALIAFLAYQNATALTKLHTSQQQDKAGHYTAAQTTLHSINQFGLLPSTQAAVKKEQATNTSLIGNEQKIQQTQQSTKNHDTTTSPKLLGTSPQSGSTKTPAPTNAKSSGGPNTSSGQSGSSTGTTPSSPPGPMSQITINSFTATASAYNASSCHLASSVNFSVNGSGSVHVTWMNLSAKTSSAIDNPVTYTFSSAGSQTDSPGGITLQGLEPGDSYKISAVITDTMNGAVTTTAGPTVITTCAAPPPLETASQQSYMTSAPTPLSLTSTESQDTLFGNECSMNLKETFSVSGPGSVQLTYTLTSGASVGATLFASQQWDFTGPGSATDSSYIRMPHVPGGGLYTITATLNVLGDPSHSITSSSITSACD